MTKNEFFLLRLSDIIYCALHSHYATSDTLNAMANISAMAHKGIDNFDIDSLAEFNNDTVSKIALEDVKRLIQRTEKLCIAGELKER